MEDAVNALLSLLRAQLRFAGPRRIAAYEAEIATLRTLATELETELLLGPDRQLPFGPRHPDYPVSSAVAEEGK
jgi:hypothetical protein